MVLWPSGKAAVCKTAIRGFDSRQHLFLISIQEVAAWLVPVGKWRGRIVGLVRSPGKTVGEQSPREFESRSLRHFQMVSQDSSTSFWVHKKQN